MHDILPPSSAKVESTYLCYCIAGPSSATLPTQIYMLLQYRRNVLCETEVSHRLNCVRATSLGKVPDEKPKQDFSLYIISLWPASAGLRIGFFSL